MSEYLAHIAEDGRAQTNAEHLRGTAALAARFAAAFDAADWGELTGLGHDIGKYSAPFQKRIRGADVSTDHSTLGAQVLMAQGAIPAAFCVAGHHGGLPDGGNSRDLADAPTLFGRRKKEVANADGWRREVALPPTPAGPRRDHKSMAFFTRMLFSCLVDADYLDTEGFMRPDQAARGDYPPLTQLLDNLNAHLDREGFLRPVGALNELRAEVLRASIDAGAEAPGLFSLTVPTGGGKTVSSLAFALNHAIKNGMDRVIYVIPYCSIIDQTVTEFRKILGDDSVLAHYGGAEAETDENGYVTAKAAARLLAAENWDMPVVVTTAVQFFESLHAAKPAKCRKLHNIARSVIVFDEAQTLPVSCLEPCVWAIGELIMHHRASAVLMTATQPALDPLFRELAPALKRREIAPDVEGLFSALKRTTLVRAGKLMDDDLAERLMAHEQVLCIVNSRKHARSLYAKLRGEHNIHLTTLMYPAQRIALIREIGDRLENGLPCRVVATSLIEAGVDLDFPAVYRAEAGLDSILQAAGRCNREGIKPAEASVVTIFSPEEQSPRLFRPNIGAFEETALTHNELNTPAAIHEYFSTLMDFKRGSLDRYDVIRSFAEGLDGRIYPFRTVAERFRMIDNDMRTVYIPVPGNEGEIEALRRGEADRATFRALGAYGVGIYPDHFRALAEAGDVEVVDPANAVLINPALYDDRIGLSLAAEVGKGHFT